jgi:hypothetical protein
VPLPLFLPEAACSVVRNDAAAHGGSEPDFYWGTNVCCSVPIAEADKILDLV